MKKLALLILLAPSFAFAGEDIMSALRDKLSYLNQRQSVISANIANADTPNYKAYDLAPMATKKQGSSRLKLRTTAPGHVSNSNSGGRFKKIRDRNTYETAPNGNNVILEEQMVKMAETEMEYQATTSIMKQAAGLVRKAIGDQR